MRIAYGLNCSTDERTSGLFTATRKHLMIPPLKPPTGLDYTLALPKVLAKSFAMAPKGNSTPLVPGSGLAPISASTLCPPLMKKLDHAYGLCVTLVRMS